MTNVKEWLDQEPPESEIRYINGLQYLPIEIVEGLLDELTNGRWSTRNFVHQYFEYGGTLWISASLELIINISTESSHPMIDGNSSKERFLVGTSSFPLYSLGANIHYASSAKSFCISNGASELGRRFGRFFNKVEIPEDSQKPKVKLKPDVIVRRQYSLAQTNKDAELIYKLENVYDFNA